MKNKFYIPLIIFGTLLSCKAPLSLNYVETQKNISIGEELIPDAKIEAEISPYKKELETKMNAKISYTPVELTKFDANNTLGNLLADFTYDGAVEWTKQNQLPTVDAAILNIGGIRANLNKGDILLKHIYEIMPFDNELVIIKMDGKAMAELFNYYLATQKHNPVSKLYIETENEKLIKTLIQNQPLNTEKTYYIATSDFLALGGDGMKFFSNGTMVSTGIKLRDLFIEKFGKQKEIVAPTDSRLIFKK